MSDGMDVIEPASTGVSFGGRTVEIRPLTVGQLPAVMRALKGVDLSRGFEMGDMPGLIADYGEKLELAISTATGIALAEIKGGAMDEYVALVGAVVEVNADFFARRVAPVLQGAVERITQKVGAGLTPSRS